MRNPLTPEENRTKGIEYLRGELRLNLAAAIRSVDNVVRDIDDLARDDLYDVEYAEGGRDVQDMRAFLADARRFLVAAEALNPCREPATPATRPSLSEDPCARGCSDPAAHAEGGHDV